MNWSHMFCTGGLPTHSSVQYWSEINVFNIYRHLQLYVFFFWNRDVRISITAAVKARAGAVSLPRAVEHGRLTLWDLVPFFTTARNDTRLVHKSSESLNLFFHGRHSEAKQILTIRLMHTYWRRLNIVPYCDNQVWCLRAKRAGWFLYEWQ